MSRSSDVGRFGPSLSRGLYAVAILLVLLSAVDFAGATWPFQPGDPGWRYGATGLLSGFLVTPLVGVALAAFVAVDQRHGAVLRVLGIVAVGVGALLLVTIVAFSLDAIQVRRGAATPEMRRLTELSAAKAGLKLLAGAIGTLLLGIGLLRQTSRSGRPAEEQGPVVVGR